LITTSGKQNIFFRRLENKILALNLNQEVNKYKEALKNR
jgi:hypothetical protein